VLGPENLLTATKYRGTISTVKPVSTPLPDTLRPLFWDVDFTALDWETDRDPIVRRILGVGGWPALRWLRSTWGDENLRGWLIAHHGGRLSPRQLRYWELILELPPQQVNEWIAQARSSLWERRVSP
jgi:hypothetical protein